MSKLVGKAAVFLDIYKSVYASRELDILEQDYTQRGEAFFHVSGSGHENIAFLNPWLIKGDFLHCHYRDKSLMLARGVSIKQFFLSLFCKDQSHSRGRQMSAHLSDPANNVLSLVGPVGNNALQAVGVATIVKDREGAPLVLCGLGDGTSQQGEVLEAVAHAVRDSLPVLFVIEDNNWAISTKTRGRTFFSRPDGEATEFYGIPIVRLDGKDPEACYEGFGSIVGNMRKDRKPAIVIFKASRLNSHTNADDHRTYRELAEIEETRQKDDPVPILEKWLLANGMVQSDLDQLKKEIKAKVQADSIEAQDSPEPQAVHTAKADLPARLSDGTHEYRGKSEGEQITMLEALREVLKARMEYDGRVRLFGEDIEDPKGDVFGVTRGLSQNFPGRVVNSPLAEASIVGITVGQALAGERPVAFLQFADFFPIAWNQIVSELASMHWRTDGAWPCSVILMVTCGGFKPGLGPFHASSMESVAVHTPGVDVYLPSTAGDAAGLLNAAFDSGRPTVFFYPKSLLNDRTQATSKDVARQFVPIGKARLRHSGDAITLVGWGNTMPLLEKAAAALDKAGAQADVYDLRSLSPWDEATILASVRKTRRIIVAQEDNSSASMASEIIATVAEKAQVEVDCRRVSRPDTFVPCNFANQLEVLPSYRRILTEAVEMLGGTIRWQQDNSSEAGIAFVEAVGSSPSDESVTVIEWKVKPGDILKPGMILAELEADKAAFEMSCPMGGTLKEILVPVGDMVKVGTPMLKVAIGSERISKKPLTFENPGTPVIELPSAGKSVMDAVKGAAGAIARTFGGGKPAIARDAELSSAVAGIASVSAAPGSRLVSNDEIVKTCPEWGSGEEIFKRIGIESRYWAADNEDTLTLAVRAATDLLRKEGMSAADLSAVICTSGTPLTITPSLACLVLDQLAMNLTEKPLIPAWDINAACSGYLYALQAAYDHLANNPAGRVLVVTSEVLSRRTNPADESTAPIFGDAASATLLVGANEVSRMRTIIERPVLAAKAENGDALSVPLAAPDSWIHMNGPKVFQEAVSHMVLLLERACTAAGIKPSDLDLVVPHQANQRILNAVRQKARLPEGSVYSNIKNFGNTSSSSIPLALERILSSRNGSSEPQLVGLAAFGGGFTFAGAVMKLRGGR